MEHAPCSNPNSSQKKPFGDLSRFGGSSTVDCAHCRAGQIPQASCRGRAWGQAMPIHGIPAKLQSCKACHQGTFLQTSLRRSAPSQPRKPPHKPRVLGLAAVTRIRTTVLAAQGLQAFELDAVLQELSFSTVAPTLQEGTPSLSYRQNSVATSLNICCPCAHALDAQTCWHRSRR